MGKVVRQLSVFCTGRVYSDVGQSSSLFFVTLGRHTPTLFRRSYRVAALHHASTTSFLTTIGSVRLRYVLGYALQTPGFIVFHNSSTYGEAVTRGGGRPRSVTIRNVLAYNDSCGRFEYAIGSCGAGAEEPARLGILSP